MSISNVTRAGGVEKAIVISTVSQHAMVDSTTRQEEDYSDPVSQTTNRHASKHDSAQGSIKVRFVRLTARLSDTFPVSRLGSLAHESNVVLHYDAFTCVTPFKAVVTWSWAQRLARSRIYQVFNVLWLLAIVALYSTYSSNPQPVLVCCMVCVGLVQLLLELTRFDRAMVRAVVSRFEWWILAIATLQMTVLAPWAQYPEYDLVMSIPLFGGYFIFVVVILGMSDAAPSYPYWLRVFGALLLFVGTIKQLIEHAIRPYIHAYSLCLVFCSDTSVLVQAPATTCAIFLFKHLISLIRFPNRCIIASTQLHFAVRKGPPPVARATTTSTWDEPVEDSSQARAADGPTPTTVSSPVGQTHAVDDLNSAATSITVEATPAGHSLAALAPLIQSGRGNGSLSARAAADGPDAYHSRPIDATRAPPQLVRSRSLSKYVASFPLPDGVDLDEDLD